MRRKPDVEEVYRAIDTYLRVAYDGGRIPSAIQSRLATLHAIPAHEFYQSPVLERAPEHNPTRFSIRLGNRYYPHMKLTIDRRPDDQGYLFRADTHDRHCCPPPESREYDAFCQLMKANQDLAQAVEKAWQEEGLPTFRSYLREDLARRQAVAAPPPQ